jgi:hypothetical protein
LDDFDLRWEGVLPPGFTYTLSRNASTLRDVRALPGGEFLFTDGSTELSAMFNFSFGDGMIVDIDELSVGAFKARFE